MRNNNVLGVIFSASSEKQLSQLTQHRTTASVPIGGKYRMIDFTLSNMANSNINNVGIIAKSGYMSLMDHVGSGKAWDLSRKHKGVTILPPYSGVSFANDIETLYQLRGFIDHGSEEYVLIARSNVLTNTDYTPVFKSHTDNHADITLVYKKMSMPENYNGSTIDHDETGRVKQILVQPDVQGECNLFIGSVLIRKSLLLDLISQAMSEGEHSFSRLLQKAVSTHSVYAYGIDDYCAIISSINEYFKFNMSLMDSNIRYELTGKHPIYTKVRDDAPCRYGLESSVKNSLVSKGCLIEGTVENCVISKGVHIAKGAVVRNCIIMQDTKISENSNLNYVIIDKDVIIGNGKALMGSDSYPIYIAKRSVI